MALVGVSTGVNAQHMADSSEQSIRASAYSVKTWTTAEGLPANYIDKVVQTQDGYLWMATAGGLVRFDGITFDVFTRERLSGWTTNDVANLYRGDGNTLWLVSRAGELASHHDRQFTTWPEAHMAGVIERGRGTLWMNSSKGLLKAEDGDITTYTPRDGLPSSEVTEVHRDQTGQIWVGTPAGLVRLTGGQPVVYTTEDGLPSNEILEVYEDRVGRLWVLTPAGLARREGNTFTLHARNDRFAGSVRGAFVDRNRTLWVFMESQLIRVQDGTLRSYTVDREITNVLDWATTPDGTL